MTNVNPFKYDLRSRTISPKDYDRFLRAVTVAYAGQHDRVRVGAVVARGAKVFGSGANMVRNSVENVPYGHVTTHAEVGAITNTPWEQRYRSTIYVARLGASDDPMPSFPCDSCMDGILRAQLKEIVYFDGNALVKVRL